MRIIPHLLLMGSTLGILHCGGPIEFESTFAPTGAKGVIDPFGRQVFLDEECGGTDSPDYQDYFQNALFRDGAIARDTLWLVDGSHVWSAPFASDATDIVVAPQVVVPYVGRANAVVAQEEYLAVALIGQGVNVYPDYRWRDAVHLPDGPVAIDADAADGWLAVAAGFDGVLIYDMHDPAAPVLVDRFQTDGYASGVKWRSQGASATLYFSACRRVGHVQYTAGERSDFTLSKPLSHRNAKDADGNGTRMVVANNGGGVWFYEMEGMAQPATYEISDPNFYANSVFVRENLVYVAAGNREIVALSMLGSYTPEPEASFPKDPLGILVAGDIVYGFGNFRDIGERTVVRAPEISGSARSIRAFEAGYTPWREAKTYAFVVTLPGSVERLVRRELSGYAVYEAGPMETRWRLLPELKFFATAGTYSVSVTSDNQIRLAPNGSTGSTVLGTWPEPFPQGAWAGISNGLLLLHTESGAQQFILSEESYYSGLTFFDDSEFPLFPVNGADISKGQSLLRHPSCLFSNSGEEGGFSQTILFGAETGTEEGVESVGWCSRQVDPYVPGNRPADDMGTAVFFCHPDQSCEPVFRLTESGVIGLLRIDDEWYGLLDDRIALTTSIVHWQEKVDENFVAETGSAEIPITSSGHEVARYVRAGRPEGWALQPDGSFRVWMADGSAFTYDIENQHVSHPFPSIQQ